MHTPSTSAFNEVHGLVLATAADYSLVVVVLCRLVMGREHTAPRSDVVRKMVHTGGLFEICVWYKLKRVHILLAAGTNIMNVYKLCGAA